MYALDYLHCCDGNTALASVRAAVDSGRLPLFPTDKVTLVERIRAEDAITDWEVRMCNEGAAEADDVIRWVRALFCHAFGGHAVWM